VRDLLRAVAGPVICAVVVTGLLAAWAGTGGGGTLTRVRLQVTQAAVPMRSFTPQAAAAVHAATTFLTITNLSGTPDELVAARSPFARRVVLRHGGPAQGTPAQGGGAQDGPLVIPAHGTLTLTPIGDDLVLEQPSPYESRATVPLTLIFRHSGTVTIDAPVTGPGTP
jgi:copper(I)-binding protein